jgi:hypothetical protein
MIWCYFDNRTTDGSGFAERATRGELYRPIGSTIPT